MLPLDEKAMKQAFDYSDALGSVDTLLTNGEYYFCYKYNETENVYVRIEELPNYKTMLTGDCIELPQEPLPERIPYERLEKELKKVFAKDRNSYYTEISKYTPMCLALPAFNLCECLHDVRASDAGRKKVSQASAWRKILFGEYYGRPPITSGRTGCCRSCC